MEINTEKLIMPTDRIGSLDTGRIAKIMTVALEEFARNSYHHASYNRIIRNCGMSKGTMYYYFRSKEDLFLTLLHAVIKEFSSLSRGNRVPSSPEDYWQQTRLLITQVFQRLQEKPILGKFIQGFVTAESRRSTNPSQKTVVRIDEWLQDYVLTGQLLGAVRRDIPMELIINLIWGIWETFCQWLKEGERNYPADESSSLLTDLWQRSLAFQVPAPLKAGLSPREKEATL